MKQGKQNNNDLPTLKTLPLLPSNITTSEWFTQSVNNTELVNVGGESWKIHLMECYNPKTKDYNVELVKSKVTFLKQFGKRPPKSDSVGSNGEDFSETMIKTKQDIITLINKSVNSDGVFVGKSGKSYKIQNPFFREYVSVNGTMKMKTTLPKGTTYTDHEGKERTK